MDLLDRTPLSPADIPKITSIGLSSFGFFAFCYVTSATVMGAWKSNKIYQELSDQKKADYISRIVANIHAVIAVILASISLFCTW